MHHIRPANITPSHIHYNDHADLLLLKHDIKLYVDVTVTRPTGQTNLAIPGVLHKPLWSTKVPTRKKLAKYRDIAEANQYTLVPFVMESYGGIAPDAAKLLARLSKHCEEYEPAEFLRHAHDRLSACMQTSNANIQQLAMQDFHLLHARPHSQVAVLRRLAIASATRGTYCQPLNSDRLAQQLETKLQQHSDVTAAARENAHPSSSISDDWGLAAAAAPGMSDRQPFVHADRRDRFGLTVPSSCGAHHEHVQTDPLHSNIKLVTVAE